jgi:mono/diheme cytochrome c family protein
MPMKRNQRISWVASLFLVALFGLQVQARQVETGAQASTNSLTDSLSDSITDSFTESLNGDSADALVNQYCVTCHNQTQQTAGLMLDTIDVSAVGDDPVLWEKVVRKLRTGMMPPVNARKLEPDTRDALATWLESSLDDHARANPNPGRPALHRLNRTEYGNAIRDILGIEVDVLSLLPGDAASYGFDNIAGSLVTSPVLLERYVAAAGKISRLAVGDPAIPASQARYVGPPRLTQRGHVDGLPFGTRGGMLVDHFIPLDAEYEIRFDMVNEGGTVFGMNNAEGEQLEFTLDGERIELFDLGDYEHLEGLKIRVPIRAGTRSIGAAFLRRNHAPVEDLLKPIEASLFEPSIGADPNWTFVLHLDAITITGPYESSGPGQTESRDRIFTCRPESLDQEPSCASSIVSSLAERAYRREANAEDLEVLMRFFYEGREKGSFDAGIEMALRRILASPEFIFRFEPDPLDLADGDSYPVSDLELASRLSFFLWSSIPDPELFDIANQGRLRNPGVLEAEVERMLSDPRSVALVDNFAGQWLYLRNLNTAGGDSLEFPDFDENLRRALRRETELFFETIIREDRDVTDLLTANDTFLNERLAKHYGIPDVYGSHFRRVELAPEFSYRQGLLGKGSILMVTSYPNRTSPVQRGKWILENVLGAAVPTAPPNVPLLEDRPDPGTQALSVRELMEAHRVNPICASCHRIMDPIGFSLENFDAIGRWRDQDHGNPIDATGVLVDGSNLDGPAGLRQAVLRYSHQFVQNMTERLLTYAIGRGVDYYDMPLVRSIAREAEADGYRFSSLVLGIVSSDAFQMRAAESGAAVETASR